MAILTLLTDFGLDDYYVAAVKGVVLRLAPGVQLVDLTHGVAPGDVAGAAFLLAATVPWYPAGAVHLAVVDPGVGSRRRILVAESGEALLVAPDNGLLTPLLPSCRGVRAVTRSDLFLPGPGNTFHGRDRFAPLAAALLRGTPAAELGPEIDDPVRLPAEPPRASPGEARGRVVHIDRFGNAVTDIPAAWLPAEECTALVAGRTISWRVACYADIPPGEPALLEGSLGTVEISLNGERFDRAWNVHLGAPIRILWRAAGADNGF